MTLTNFSERDFQRANPPCHIDDMDKDFLLKLQACRTLADIPFVITSAYRTKAHEISKGRSGKSAHTERCAVDIACTDSTSRFTILNAAIRCGFKRIGIHKTFIHLDSSNNLPQGVTWLY